MAIALDGSYATSAGAVGSTKTISSFTVSSNANRYLIVGIGSGAGEPDVTGVTWNSTSLTLLKDSTAASDGGYRTYLYGLVAPASATADIVVTLSGSGNERTSVGAAVYTGVDQSTPIGTAVSALVVGGNPTVDVSSASGELVIDAIGVSLDSTPVVGGGQTERVNVYDGSNCRFGMSEEAGAGTVTMSWTGTTGFDSATCAVPLKPATSATLEQEGFRWYEDNGSESAASASAAQDTNITAAAGATKRLRMLVNATGDPATKQFKLQWKKSGGSWADVL